MPIRRRQTRLGSIQSTLPLSELIKRTRILVIDDVADEFPFTVLRDEGYAIDHWEDVRDLGKLESGAFDIIILDIGGIGVQYDAEKEGMAILAHLKQTNPSQVVVAFSGQSYDLVRFPFFNQADDVVSKPTNAIVWKETIDRLIVSKLTPSHYWIAMRSLLEAQGVSARRIRRIERAIVESKDRNLPLPDVTRLLETFENATTLITIAAKIITLLS